MNRIGLTRSTCFRNLTLALVAGLLASCASLNPANRSVVELRSDPSGAEVRSLSGELLGVTPLFLSGETLKKVSNSGRLTAYIESRGYAPVQVLLDIHGEDAHEFKLMKLDGDYFAKRLILDFQSQANEMVRTLLQIQGQLAVRKIDDAEKALAEFQKSYPNIAAGYVLMGNIELIRGNSTKAMGYLRRAQSLDPNDAVIERLLRQGDGSAARKGGAP